MIPLRLKLSGFLSYRDPAELDFTTFELACISGENGAGKSSLLDAITWVLFGQARKKDDSIINSFSAAAEVALSFQYEGATYRIQRTLPRGKTTILEFQILEEGGEEGKDSWRPLSERTTRETQARIEQVLHLDYDTFVNASFFLQGKADQFTQQKASDRKRILASILGLDAWEEYKNRTADRRKEVERELDGVEGRVGEINDELAEEDQRKANLVELESRLSSMSATRKTQEAALESIRQASIAVGEQRKHAEGLRSQLQRNKANLEALQGQLTNRENEKKTYADLIQHADEIETAHNTWMTARESLQKWDSLATTFHKYERQRQPYLDEINTEKARLEQEQLSLNQTYEKYKSQKNEVTTLASEIKNTEAELEQNEQKVLRRDEQKSELDFCREQAAALKAENDALKIQMDETKARIDQITNIEGAACPLCGQPLTAKHRKSTIDQLKQAGKEMGDRWRSNKNELEKLQNRIKHLETDLNKLSNSDKERLALSSIRSRQAERLAVLQKDILDWESSGDKRLKDVNKFLEKENFTPQARKALTALDKEYKKLGYDASAHNAARQDEAAGRESEQKFQSLEKARAAMSPLDREISSLKTSMENTKLEMEQLDKDHQAIQASIEKSSLPDLDLAERELFSLQEQENRLNQDVGAARQKVNVLEDLRIRKKRFEIERESLAARIGNFKLLERAFGKDGVPALLIEQALPEIETKANEILDRLSNGAMSVRFITQRGYKDSKRDDLKETLDIQISDSAGLRDYEMFSGGEVFRVNFAVRLALSEILARRTGARLQTLVVDEGFGSQDAQGRQRLIEAINSVQKDFAKILVITHLEELKEAFPNRIVVEKTLRGSTLQVF